jgi:antitoxin component of MazEF toxin-antitoxin module
MIKKLTKHGNSYALVIERPIMDLLHINEKSALYVTTDGRNLIVTPAEDKKKETRFESAVAKSLKKFPRMYKNLAG